MSFGINYMDPETGKAHSINGERYVYYNRLATDKDDNDNPLVMSNGYLAKELYNKAKNLLDYRVEAGSDAYSIAMYFKDLAKNEHRKEAKLLLDKFNVDVSKYDSVYYSADEIIEAFNFVLSTKEIFERNVKLITDTKGQKGLFTWFPTYFKRVVDNYTPFIFNNIDKSLKEDALKASIEEVMIPLIPDMVREALRIMMTETNAENGLSEEDQASLRNAYAELSSLLDSNAGNEFVQGMMDVYNIEEVLRDSVKKSVKNGSSKINFSGGNVHTNGGYAMEHFGKYLAEYVTQELSNSGLSVNVQHTGSTSLQKADFKINFDIPDNFIEAVESNMEMYGGQNGGFNSIRGNNVSVLQEFKDYLKKFDDGFIVYVNSKNYTLKSHGYSAGEPINLEAWDDIIHAAHIRGRDFIFTVLQTIKGAIGDKDADKVNTMFARLISAMLFDDFDTVGKYKNKGANSIHLLYLNGVYFPLSVYYNLLYEAFLKYYIDSKDDSQVRKLISVTIKKPDEIMYPEQKDQAGIKNAWYIQSKTAMKETYISYHFLQGLKSIFKDLDFEF